MSGREHEFDSNSNVVTRAYDDVGRLNAETLTIGGLNYSLSYGFDAANRRVSETYPNAQSVARSYTDRDELASVGFGGSAVVSSFSYDLGGRESSRALANGVTQSRTWFRDNLPEIIVAPNVVNLGYTWDANKRKTQEDNLLYAAHTNNYTGYDDEDRLTGWQRDGVGDSQSWGLSKVGDWNTTTVNGVTETRTHNAVHEIQTITPPVPAVPLVHDVKGNLTTNKNGQVYTWDVENRLATATVPVAPPGDPLVHSYAYDALGRRVSKTVGEVTTTYINNADWQEIAEYQGETLIQSYVFGSYIDEVLCMVKANGARFHYSTNDLYSVYALTDGAGTVVERYCYTPYGACTVLDGNGTPRTVNESLYGNPWTFGGRRLDQETGLMYFRNRMYDTGLGRFIGRDPMGYVDGYGLQGAYFVPKGVDPQGTVTGDFKPLPEERGPLVDMTPWAPGVKPGQMPGSKHGLLRTTNKCTPKCVCVGISSGGLLYSPRYGWEVTTKVVLHTKEDAAAWKLIMAYIDDTEGVFKDPNSSQAQREDLVRKHENKHLKDAEAAYELIRDFLEQEERLRFSRTRCQAIAQEDCALVQSDFEDMMRASQKMRH